MKAFRALEISVDSLDLGMEATSALAGVGCGVEVFVGAWDILADK